ncbi:hypothetical protein N7493_011882 [Penicillium malachiteum]|uniref:Uncharacterized protein n=1 Tax=Penicillium malachiteum TaxID=1324776 RepID=A0AAD6MQB4_9EURO|nr:hypothetical protein N7493_011882 [Penicillium malachiteum]
MQDPRLSNSESEENLEKYGKAILTTSEVKPRPIVTLDHSLGQKPQEDPTGFAQFVMMVLGFEVLLQHRAYGSQGTKKENEQ